MVMDVVNVRFQHQPVGALSFNTETGLGAFQYEPGFIKTGIELAPLQMPLGNKIYSFPQADPAAFWGLPGMIADSLPDDFGNAVLNEWVAQQGKTPSDITPLQRLKYTGKRGMGALEYSPARQLKSLNASQSVEIQALVGIAQEILSNRQQFSSSLAMDGREDKEAMMALMSVGMSAGGARAKAVLAFNDNFSQVRSGQTDAPEGFNHYILKFDGVSEHRKSEETFGDPLGYCAMEYVYYLMAKSCGIRMMPSQLLIEGDRRHFLTRRFDRRANEKIHVQTLAAMTHVSYKQTGSYSYAELLATARKLGLDARDAEQIFRQMVFNVIARNHDDHSKNFSFMLNEKTEWQLSPAYDLAFSYKPGSKWVNQHWMSINGKRDNFTRDDFYSFEKLSPVFSRRKIDMIIDETIEHVSSWPTRAKQQHVPVALIHAVSDNLRLSL
jgi:serine/threonine-protein kinase HipA